MAGIISITYGQHRLQLYRVVNSKLLSGVVNLIVLSLLEMQVLSERYLMCLYNLQFEQILVPSEIAIYQFEGIVIYQVLLF
jgi:hypothetical protein